MTRHKREDPDQLEERSLTPIIVLVGILVALFIFKRAAEHLVAGGPPAADSAPAEVR